ncbi:MAG: adenylate/guanylate cyclase domain-containing protein [Spirochaetota bacterium]
MQIASAILLYYYRIKKGNKAKNRYILITGAIGVLTIVYVSILVGREVLVHLFLFPYILFPLFIFTKKDIKIIVLAVTLDFFMINFIYWWHSQYQYILYVPPLLKNITRYFCLSFMTSGFFVFGYFFWKETNSSEEKIIQEQEKSDKLLLNILPTEIAQELKEQGYTKPKLYSSVSVVFTDFVGFTSIAEKLSPQDLVSELDRCFSHFDSIIKKYNLEKIKTIGDSYMAAGGIPLENKTHCIDCVLAAMEIQSFMARMQKIKQEQQSDYWQLRLGIHTGPLVAGVVGEMKFAYDVWGDTVNTASRMESSSVSGEINISQSVYEVTKDLFVCEHRGKIAAKRKGNVDMYFIKGIRKEYSVDGKGHVPNDKFQKVYQEIEKTT